MLNKALASFNHAMTKPRFGEDRGLNSSTSLAEVFKAVGLGIVGTAVVLAPIYFLRAHDIEADSNSISVVKSEQVAPRLE